MDTVDRGPYGGGSLAHILDIAELPDGHVLVLDPQYKKIAIYNSDGTFDRLILGGSGEGPGEFGFPVSLAYSEETESLFVYDYQLLRITEFDLSGEVLRVISSPFRGKDIYVDGERILLTRRPAREHLLVELSLDGSHEPQRSYSRKLWIEDGLKG